MNQKTFAQDLRLAFKNELPGANAQEKLAIVNRSKFNANDRQHAKQAAVNVLLSEKDEEIYATYIKRIAHKKDRHSGQISFPGGKKDETDTTLLFTAQRELKEEIDVTLKDEDYLGELTSLYIPVSNFLVHPFVAYLDYTPDMKAEESEVDFIIQTSLTKLLNEPIQRKQISGQGYTIPNAPFFDMDGHTLWGATAMMTNELLELIRGFGK